jgi:CubicO group peptidase (beta-lactamase class C family)
MVDTDFRPSYTLRDRIAPTGSRRGEVHDENAFVLGGVAGHAGLFSTAADLSVFAQMMLNGGEYDGTRLIADSTVALFTKRAAGTRALGWDTCGGSGSCGKYMSDRAFGHTGFTGTSLWIDPDRQMFVILLTNRVDDPRAKRPATVIEDIRADLADAAALAVTDSPDGMLEMPDAFRADKAIGWNRPVRRSRARTHAIVSTSTKKKAVVTTSSVVQAGAPSVSAKKAATPIKPLASKGDATKPVAAKPATTGKGDAHPTSSAKTPSSK